MTKDNSPKEKSDKTVYKTNFIKNVIFKIDFNIILKLQKELPDDFQEQIRNNYPKIKIGKQVHTNFNLPENSIEEITVPMWIFSNEDNSIKISLSFNSLIIEVDDYANFPEYACIIKSICDPFISIYKPSMTRFGLRYINEIILETGNTFDWKNIINSSLTSGIDNFVNDKTEISRAMNQIILNRDDYKINFNYGMFNRDYPNKISKKEFLLDYDFYTNDADSQNIYTYLDKFNEEARTLFEKSIENKLRNIMNGAKDGL